jgi:hypothetical protein
MVEKYGKCVGRPRDALENTMKKVVSCYEDRNSMELA